MTVGIAMFVVVCALGLLAFLLWCAYDMGYDRGWWDGCNGNRNLSDHGGTNPRATWRDWRNGE